MFLIKLKFYFWSKYESIHTIGFEVFKIFKPPTRRFHVTTHRPPLGGPGYLILKWLLILYLYVNSIGTGTSFVNTTGGKILAIIDY